MAYVGHMDHMAEVPMEDPLCSVCSWRVDSGQGVGTGGHILAGGMSELLWADGC